jgi:hypothetical protein
MVKTPRTRHAKGGRLPVTIDLEASEAGRAPEDEMPSTRPDDAAVPPPDAPPQDTEAVEAREAAAAAFTPGETAGSVTEPSPAQEPTAEGPDWPDRTTDEPAAPIRADGEEESSTETGTSIPSEQEYRSAESLASAAETDPDPLPLREEPKQATSIPLPPPPVVRKDGLGRIAAGVIGGVVVLAVAGGMQAAGLLGYPGAGGEAPDRSAEIAGLRQEIEALKAAGGDNEADPRIAELGRNLDTLRTELAAVRESIPASGADADGLGTRLDSLESEIQRLSSGMATPEALAALGERVAAAETQVQSAQEASTSATDRLAALEQSVASLTSRVDAQSQQPKIALAIATAALKAAVDRGAPFLAELETFAAIHPDTPEIEALRGFAESGVPTREALRAETDAAATAMIAAAAPADPNDGFFDRLLSSAESLVTVRPIGEVSGTGVPETIARMEVALNGGELEQALSEYGSLPDPVKQAGAAFAARLKARADVEQLVDQAIANAMRA